MSDEDTGETMKERVNRLWKFVTEEPTPPEDDPKYLHHKMNSNMFFAIVSCSFGAAFQHGYNTGVVNVPHRVLENFIRDTLYDQNGEFPEDQHVSIVWSVVVSFFPLGGMIGAMISFMVVRFVGLRCGLLVNNVLVFLAAGLQGFSKRAQSLYMLVAGRFVIGINCGINASLVPMYLTEISPVNLRGAIGSVYPLIITITILVSQLFGLPQFFGTDKKWPFLFGLISTPAIIMTLTLFFCPESPVRLVSQGEEEKAEQALQWLLRSDSVDKVMDYLKQEVEIEKSTGKVPFDQMLREKSFLTPIGISVMIMLAQQWSGVGAVLYFSTTILQEAGLDENVAVYSTLAMGMVNVIMTLLSMRFVEVTGRKTLMLVSLAGMANATFILTFCIALKNRLYGMHYFSIACILGYMMAYASGMGSVPMFIVSELFTPNIRPKAKSIAVSVHWLANFIVALSFLPLAIILTHFVFLVFTILIIAFAVLISFQVPETKGRTIEDISKEFQSEIQ